MITSISSSFAATRFAKPRNKEQESIHNPLFSGKKHDTDTIHLSKKHQSGAPTAKVNPALLSKFMILGGPMVLGGLANGSPVENKKEAGGHHFFKRSIPDAQISQNVQTLVPGLTESQAVTVLQRPPFAPTDKNIFNSAVYADVSASPAACDGTASEQDVKSQLRETLKGRFGNGPAVGQGMSLFDSKELKAVAPDPRLRGAVVNLLGTTGEAAIDAYKNGVFGHLEFADMPANFVGLSVNKTGENVPTAQINSRYQCEQFQLHSPAVGHEALHQDNLESKDEELSAHALDSLTHAQLLLENPDLIKQNTEYTQRLNTKLMARLNTRDQDGNLRIYTSQGNVYPGGKVSLASFGDNFVDSGADTPGGAILGSTSPGNAVLRGELQKATGVQKDNADFDDATVGIIDQNQNVLDPVGLVALAKVLKLDTGDIPQSSTTSSLVSKHSGGKPTHTPKPHKPQTSGAQRTHRFFWS